MSVDNSKKWLDAQKGVNLSVAQEYVPAIEGHEINFIGPITQIKEVKDGATVIYSPRSPVHIHTYGLLTPFFDGLKKGKLMATRCTNKDCPNEGLWVPPRADCPDCNLRMEWEEVPGPVVGEVFTFTKVAYPGAYIDINYPYYQIDILVKGLVTIIKGYLVRGVPKIGMKVKAGFRTEHPTNTILDVYWEPAD